MAEWGINQAMESVKLCFPPNHHQDLGRRNYDRLFSCRHSLHFFAQPSPVVCLQLGVFDSLLAPILVEAANMVLTLLKVRQFISDALPDENAACML